MNICSKLATWQHKGNKKTGTIYICYLCYLCYPYIHIRIDMYPIISSIINTLKNTYVLFSIRSVFSKKSGNFGNTIKNHIGLATVYVTLMCSLLPKLQKSSHLITETKSKKWQHRS